MEEIKRFLSQIGQLAAVYGFMVGGGLIELLNFFPSSRWILISVVLSVAVSPFVSGLRPSRDGALAKVVGGALTILFLYFGVAYSIGPAATALSNTIVKKDIAGTKVFHSRLHGHIDTNDLHGDFLSNIYITRDEFHSIPQSVRMHVTLKQSFFGMTVENYTFYR